MRNVETQLEQLQELRKIKIYEAVTGKIRLNRDFEDEKIAMISNN